MLFCPLVIDTARAIFLGTQEDIGLPFQEDGQEAAAAYITTEWQVMREPYRTAVVLAMLALRTYSWLRYRRSLDKLAGGEVRTLLRSWLRFPLSPPGDFVRAMTMFCLMSVTDRVENWTTLSLDGYDRYTHALRLYHDLLSL